MHNSNNKHKHEVINSVQTTDQPLNIYKHYQGMKQENIIC